MSVDGEVKIGSAGEGDKAKAVALVALHHEGCKRHRRSTREATLAIDEGRIRVG